MLVATVLNDHNGKDSTTEQVSITLVVLDLEPKISSLVYGIISPKVFFHALHTR